MARELMRLVLRLLQQPAADGEVVGQVEIVETGEVVTVRSTSDLGELVHRLAIDARHGEGEDDVL